MRPVLWKICTSFYNHCMPSWSPEIKWYRLRPLYCLFLRFCSIFKAQNKPMKPNPIPLITACLLFSLLVNAQPDQSYAIHLKDGPVDLEKNITSQQLDLFSKGLNRF